MTTMKKTITFSILFSIAATSFAQIRIDTLQNMPVGPGCTHRKFVAPTVPWTINVLQIDLRNPYITMETAKGQDRLTGFERTSSMAARNNFAGHTVIGAVNGDFYGTTPINIQVRNGEILLKPSDKSTLSFTATQDPWLGRVNFFSFVKTLTALQVLQGINQTRGTDQLVLYNKYYGTTTGTNVFGAEALISPIGGWFVNDTLRCVVESLVNGIGNMAIPSGKAVLSGHGTAQTFMISYLHVGDTLKVWQGVQPAWSRIKEMIGGFPKIVYNGANYVDQGYQEEGGPSHTYERHPRTGAGFSADGSKLYLVTVDGRQTISAGMTLHELANFMISIGVYHGINFDGGGSTTMVVRSAIANSPSDGGGERSVSNALLVVSSAPTDTLNRIYLNPKRYRVYRGESLAYLLYGTDRYGNPIALTPSLVQFSVASRLGVIDSTGRFTAALTLDSGYVYARYGNFRDSAFVVIKSIGRIVLDPQNIVTDTLRTVPFRARAFDSDGVEKSVANRDYAWISSNTTVGVVDTIGVFKGRTAGTTQVIASYLGVNDTADVAVQIGVGVALVDSMESLTRWTASGVNTNVSVVLQSGISTFGSHSLKINYSFVYDPALLNFARLDTDIPIFGVPDSLLLDVRADSANHRVIYYVDDDNNEGFKFFSSRFVNNFAGFDTIRTALRNPIPIPSIATFNFPIRLRKIEVQLGSSRVAGSTYSGSIYVDYPRVKYPSGITAVQENNLTPTEFRLHQNYPNPFNLATTIKFDVGGLSVVSLKVFDLLGREVATLVNETLPAGSYTVDWNAAAFSSGMYFYRLTSNGRVAARKMLLVK